MLDGLKHDVCEANLALVRRGLVTQTWGNASAIDRSRGLVVIKPSGVAYDAMQPEHMVVLDLLGNVVEGDLNPSSDTPTHLMLYEACPRIGAIVHTHSHYATCWAQACRPIPCLGTTHADTFFGDVPVTDIMKESEVTSEYERRTGEAIARCFTDRDPTHAPGVLVAQHGPFAWGAKIQEAVENAATLEEIARLAFHTLLLSPDQPPIAHYLLEKHFLRKHGEAAYYGQGSK